jgi:hypothetical protein
MYDPNRWLKRSQYVSEGIVVPTRKNNTPISFNPAPIKPKNNNNRKLFKPSPPRKLAVIRTRKNRKASRKNRKTRVNRR